MDLSPDARHRIATAAAIVAAVAIVATVVSMWAQWHPLNSDRFADASAEALADPEVIDAIAVLTTDQLVDLVLAVADPRQVLPGPLQGIGGSGERWIRDQLADQMARVVATDTVQDWMVSAVRGAHDEVLVVLRHDESSTGVLIADSESVRLDLTAVLAAGLDALADRSLLPGIFSGLQDDLRGGLDEFRERVLSLSGADIGADIGTIEVYDGSAVGDGGIALRSSRWLTSAGIPLWVLPLIAVAGGVAGIAFGRDNRRYLRTFGVALVMAALTAGLYIWRIGVDIEHLLTDPAARHAAASIIDTLTGPLNQALFVVAAAGILVVAGTWIRRRPIAAL